MGRDKSRIDFEGETLADRAIRTLEKICSKVSTVGGRSFSSTPSIKDIHRAGDEELHASIFGVHSALTHSSTEWTAILACDLPFVTPELFHLLFSKTAGTENAIVPIQPYGRRQPLCALYRTKPSLDGAEEAIKSGELSMQKLLDRIGTIPLDLKEFAQLKNAKFLLINVNTPEDLELAQTIEKQN